MDPNNLVKVAEGQTLRGPDLLKILPPQTKLFDGQSSSESLSSELSGPFSDIVYSVEVENKQKAKELVGKDLYTAFSFSPELKSAVEDVKKQMILENPDYLKTENMVAENFEKIKDGSLCRCLEEDDEKPEANPDFLQFPGIDYELETKEDDAEEKRKDKETGKEKKNKGGKTWQIDDDEERLFDTMSGYWRLLSVYDEFRISPPWFDAYAEGQQHWLETKPIPPEVFEMSREKCSSWLNKYFDNMIREKSGVQGRVAQ